MSALKRIPIKYVRDKAKSRYKKDSCCYICASEGLLDFHHFLTVDILFDDWLKNEKIIIESVEDILAVRETFIEQHIYELYDYAITLCRDCHKRLHSIYGQRPALRTAEKQVRWVEIQRGKFKSK